MNNENIFTVKKETELYKNLLEIRVILESKGIIKENATTKKIYDILSKENIIVGNFIERIIDEYPQDIWNETGK